MNKTNKLMLLACGFIVTGALGVGYIKHTPVYIKQEKQVQGVVVDKFESAYSCGKYQVCYARYLLIDNQNVRVSLSDYTETRVGDVTKFIWTESIDNPKYNVEVSDTVFFLSVLLLSFGFSILISSYLFLYMD